MENLEKKSMGLALAGGVEAGEVIEGESLPRPDRLLRRKLRKGECGAFLALSLSGLSDIGLAPRGTS